MGLVFLGPPGVGKGTQGRRIAPDLGCLYISTGDMLRQAVRDDTPLGRQIADVLQRGHLVEDEIIVDLVIDRLSKLPDPDKFLLDGFPRTLGQARAFDHFLEQSGLELSGVVLLTADEAELKRRILTRAEGRSDDTEKTVDARLRVYRDQTQPLVDYYRERSKLCEVDGMGHPDEVHDRLLRCLMPLGHGKASE